MSDGGTTTDPPEQPDQAGTLSVATIHEDATGNDNDNLNDEYIIFENTGDQPLDLTGWLVADEAGHTYTFPSGFTLEPGAIELEDEEVITITYDADETVGRSEEIQQRFDDLSQRPPSSEDDLDSA